MTDLAPDPLMVSLTQAAAQLPVLLLALPAGALADVVDRRRYLIWTNLGMLVVAGALAVLYLLGLVDAILLLALTALLACVSAMNSPAWSSSVPLTVPRQDLAQALVLNSIGFNMARALGPALGGAIVAGAGAALAFGINALTFVLVAAIVGLALVFPATRQPDGLPPERIGRAIRLGLRYATAEPNVRTALIRSAAFYACASAIWALLPLYVRDVLGLASGSYGIMLGSIGAGAVLGGIAMPMLRARFNRDSLVMLAGLLTGTALLPIALAPAASTTIACMLVYGIGWIIGSSNLQATVQLACAPWVRARGLALYQAVYNGGMGLGAIAWGWLGMHAGLTGTLLAAALGSVVIALLARSQPLPSEVADPSLPARRPPLKPSIDDGVRETLMEGGHPVLVTVAYVVDPGEADAFRTAMVSLRLARRRDGAVAWRLARDISRADHWIETFRLPDWHELRRGLARINLLDDEASRAAAQFHRGDAPPTIRIYLSL